MGKRSEATSAKTCFKQLISEFPERDDKQTVIACALPERRPARCQMCSWGGAIT